MPSAEWDDKLAIRELLERYMRYNDDGALDRLVALFDEDALFQVAGRVARGHGEIREFVGRGVAHPSSGRTPSRRARETRGRRRIPRGDEPARASADHVRGGRGRARRDVLQAPAPRPITARGDRGYRHGPVGGAVLRVARLD